MENYIFRESVYHDWFIMISLSQENNGLGAEISSYSFKYVCVLQELIVENHLGHYINYTSDTLSMWHHKGKPSVTMNCGSKDSVSSHSATE